MMKEAIKKKVMRRGRPDYEKVRKAILERKVRAARLKITADSKLSIRDSN